MRTAEKMKYSVLGLGGLFWWGFFCFLVFLLFYARRDDNFLLWRQNVQLNFSLPTSLAFASIVLNPQAKKRGRSEIRKVLLRCQVVSSLLYI